MAEIRELSLVDVYMFSKHLREEGKPAKAPVGHMRRKEFKNVILSVTRKLLTVCCSR